MILINPEGNASRTVGLHVYFNNNLDAAYFC